MDVSEPGSGMRSRVPWIVVGVLTGTILMPLLVGYEPVGGDPDRLYRPIKAELARALAERRLPFWSDRIGIGVPLLAESHIAALYPPNWFLYRVFEVSTAYRLAMWGHHVALAMGTFLYARRRGLTPWGSAMAGLCFTFCGFQAIQSSHEWAYHALPFLPLALWLVEAYVETGRLSWMAVLAMVLGVQWTLGHFQIPSWTNGLVIVSGLWRILADRRSWRRGTGVMITVLWGMAIAAAQLGPTWELAEFVGRTRRSFAELAFYSYPPAHWAELAIPRLFLGLRGGPEDPYWFAQQTTGYEALLTIGTLPLMLAFVGWFRAGKGRALAMWRVVVPVTLALATMPQWWPQGYAYVLMVPGLGFFRCPARYTVLASFGLALFAGEGLDRTIGSRRFAVGLGLALVFAVTAFAWGAWWTTQERFSRSFEGESLAFRLLPAAAMWAISLGAFVAWRRGRAPSWILLAITAMELGTLYYTTTTRWGWSVPLPEASPILKTLLAIDGPVRVGGALDNLPVRVGLTTASPYIGFPLPPPDDLMKVVSQRPTAEDPSAAFWLRRLGVTHLVWDGPAKIPGATEIFRGPDAAIDQLAYRPSSEMGPRTWHVIRLPETGEVARTASRVVVVRDRQTLLTQLSGPTDANVAWFVAGDQPAGLALRASHAGVAEWDANHGVVDHDGPCLLILSRTWYPGWTARLNDGPPQPVLRVDGGLQAIAIDGKGATRVVVELTPSRWHVFSAISVGGLTLAMSCVIVRVLRREPPRVAHDT